jgi:DsbC/DsbD-like thiol-disulfide interchange protein
MTPTINFVRLPVAVLILLSALCGGAASEEVSRWDGDARSAARLIAGAARQEALRAGIEIRLKDGWHTYWRYPGDAGVPPQFDFAGSQNLKSVEVRWPAPRRLPEAGLIAIGYDRDVILPLKVTPQDPARAVTLRLKLNYAICEKLCVPAEAKIELALAAGPIARDFSLAAAATAGDSALTTAEERVPAKRTLGEGSALAIRSVRREQGPQRPRLLIDVAAPAAGAVDLFAEGPTDQWAPPLPVASQGAPPGLQRFVLDLDGAPPGETYEGAAITLTAVAGREAIEVTLPVP